MSDRFVVSSVTGYYINASRPPDSHRGGKATMPVSYYVLDREYNYEVVADFTAPFGSLLRNEKRRILAELACARLNAWDDEELAA